MNRSPTWRYRSSRTFGRFVTHSAALLTLYRMPPFVSASAIVVEEGRLLVVIDPILSEPTLPGGHLRWRETPEAATIREVEEETGLRVRPESVLAVLAGDEWAGEAGIVRVIYRAVRTGGAMRSSTEGEATWIQADELASSSSRDAGIVRLWLDSSVG